MAGKRAGLAGARSGLFMEQIRVIKEMRENDRASGRADNLIRPRYMVWENVFGAFSSNKGEDFRAVLEETAKVADKNAVIPGPPKGKWSPSGCIVGDGWSIAWRVHDAQFWGVPQRRKRIALVADFGGETAPEILFEREGVCGDSAESGEERQGATGDAEKGVGEAIKCLNSWDVQSKHIQPENGKAEALYSGECRYGGGESYVMHGINGNIAGTLDSNYYKGCGERQGVEREVVYCLQGNGIDRADTAGCNGRGWREDRSYTLNTIDRPAVCASQQAIGEYKIGRWHPT